MSTKKRSKILLALDPGETTGFALFNANNNLLIETGVCNGLLEVFDLLEQICPEQVTFESFFLYPGRAASKIFSSFPEVENIGVIRFWCLQNGIKYSERSASVAKGKYPDLLLKGTPYWAKNKHSRDAVKHGLTELGITIHKGARFSVND